MKGNKTMKITFMGAGSTVFARNVIGDCMCSEALRDSTFALYDIDEKRLAKAQKKYAGVTAYTDFEEMLKDARVECVSICLPSAMHADFAVRAMETEAVKKVSQMSGIIIATGGGVVTRKENIPYLRQNGRIIYLHCIPSDLAVTPDRPLSSSRSVIKAIYKSGTLCSAITK